MNYKKIGKFIMNERKAKKLTQAKLAEKLFVSEKTISKWENGKGVPDTSVLPNLCEILGFSLNELVNGERISGENYVSKAEEKLLEMVSKEENQNKKMMLAMWTITMTSSLFYVGIIILTLLTLNEGVLSGIIIAIATLVFIVAVFIGLKFEADAGYYECKNCHNRFKASYRQILVATHFATTRHLKCPKCHKRTWAKKVMTDRSK